jgi:hypothetical protein
MTQIDRIVEMVSILVSSSVFVLLEQLILAALNASKDIYAANIYLALNISAQLWKERV